MKPGPSLATLGPMGSSVARRLLLAVRTDDQAVLEDGVWTTRCIHCKARVGVDLRGEPLGTTTLEHIVPRAWFAKKRPGELVESLGDPDDPRNLALACARCNWGKGSRHDHRGPGHARTREVVEALLEKRRRRFRPVEG